MILRLFPFRSRRISRAVIVFAVGLALSLLLLWLAPVLLSSSSVWPRVLARLTSDLEAEVSSDPVTLRWFAPIVLDHVTIAQREGEPILSVGRISTEASLVSLVWNGGRDLGTIHVREPELTVQLQEGGSNVEDLLVPLFSGSNSSTAIRGRVAISAGRMTIADDQHRSVALFDSIEATVLLGSTSQQDASTASESAGAGTVEISRCDITTPNMGPPATGSLMATVDWKRHTHATSWTVTTQAKAFDLSLLPPLLGRWGLAARMAGTLDLDAACCWESVGSQWTFELRSAEAHALRVVAPEWLGQDQLNLQHASLQGNCAVVHDTWQLTNAQLDSDAGHLNLNGQFTWPFSGPADPWQQLLATASTGDMRLSGRAELAQLARMLPQTLRVRNDSTIESGTVDFELEGKGAGSSRRWTTRVEASDLAARRGDQQFRCQEPLQLAFTAQLENQQWRVEQFTCRSTALSITLDGTATHGRLTGQCDVGQLVGQLGEFLDLGPLEAAGLLTAQGEWRCGEGSEVTLQATTQVEDLRLAAGDATAWAEPHLTATFELCGQGSAAGMNRIDRASLKLHSDMDRLELQTLEPIQAPVTEATWTMACGLQGEWSSWLARLRPLLSASTRSLIDRCTVSGPVNLQLTTHISPRQWEFEQASLRCEPFELSTPQLRLSEPVVALQWRGRWEPGSGRLSLPEGTFQSESLALRVTDFGVAPSEEWRISGDIAFRGDLARLDERWQILAKQQDWRLGGSTQGSLSLMQQGDSTQARWSIDLVSVELARRAAAANSGTVTTVAATSGWTKVWQEPVVRLSGAGQYHARSQQITLERLELASDGKLGLSMQGSIHQPIGPCRLDVQGQVTYDLARLLQHVAPQWTERVQWTGQDTQPFQLRGPLFHTPPVSSPPTAAISTAPATSTPASAQGLIPLDLAGRARLSWQSADVMGIPIGAAAVDAQLTEGAVSLGTVEMPLSGGVLRLQPTLHINSIPPLIQIGAGEVLTDVQITSAMCDGWLKYVAPVVANATRAQGRFSLSLQPTTVPLTRPAATRTAGTLAIQSGQIAAGPMTQQLLQTVSELARLLQLRMPDTAPLTEHAWVRLPEQQTQFQIVGARVYHDQLIFESGSITVRTRGSVGFDESLALVAEIPLRDEWLSSDPRLGVLRGSTVDVPISGTLSKPQLDRRALERLAGDALRKAAGQALQNELNKGLDKLLRPNR